MLSVAILAAGAYLALRTPAQSPAERAILIFGGYTMVGALIVLLSIRRERDDRLEAQDTREKIEAHLARIEALLEREGHPKGSPTRPGFIFWLVLGRLLR